MRGTKLWFRDPIFRFFDLTFILTRDLKRVCAGMISFRLHFGQNTGWVFIETALKPPTSIQKKKNPLEKLCYTIKCPPTNFQVEIRKTKTWNCIWVSRFFAGPYMCVFFNHGTHATNHCVRARSGVGGKVPMVEKANDVQIMCITPVVVPIVASNVHPQKKRSFLLDYVKSKKNAVDTW